MTNNSDIWTLECVLHIIVVNVVDFPFVPHCHIEKLTAPHLFLYLRDIRVYVLVKSLKKRLTNNKLLTRYTLADLTF